MNLDVGKVRLETLLSHTRLAVAATDASGQITLYSPALQELMGVAGGDIPEGEMVDHFDLYAEDGTTRLPTEQIPLVRARGGEVVRDEVICSRRGDGTLAYLRCNAAPLRAGDGSIEGAVVLVQDVTLEHAARLEQDDLRDRLMVTINHELRTPLTKLLGHAERLADHRDQLPDSLRSSVDAVERSAGELQRLAEVISLLVDLENHARLTKTAGCLSELLAPYVAAAADTARDRGIEMVTDLPTHCRCFVDRVEVGRAVEALLDNAVRYAPDASQVGIRLTADASWVRIEVWDQGTGIPSGDRARLLEPFERGQHPRQPVNSRGMGLPLARTVAHAHGGELVLGDHDPRGLCVTLVLPRHGISQDPSRGDPAASAASEVAGRQAG